MPQKPNSEKINMEEKFPVNKGIPLIEIPLDIPQVGFLGGREGQEINKEIQSKYKAHGALQVASYDDGIMKGSNPFYVVAVNEIIKPQGFRTVSPIDIQEIVNKKVLNLNRCYEDLALVLNDQEGRNKYLARNLTKQIKQKTRNQNSFPIMIPLNGLKLRVNQNSPTGLTFNLTDDSKIAYVSQLKEKNDRKKYGSTNEKGMPIFYRYGNRTLRTRLDGLSRLGLTNDLGLDSDFDYLDESFDTGRVVLVSDGGKN